MFRTFSFASILKEYKYAVAHYMRFQYFIAYAATVELNTFKIYLKLKMPRQMSLIWVRRSHVDVGSVLKHGVSSVLDAFAKSRKVTISLVMSVCLSVRPSARMQQLGSH